MKLSWKLFTKEGETSTDHYRPDQTKRERERKREREKERERVCVWKERECNTQYNYN
jgi:hypothetical protein